MQRLRKPKNNDGYYIKKDTHYELYEQDGLVRKHIKNVPPRWSEVVKYGKENGFFFKEWK